MRDKGKMTNSLVVAVSLPSFVISPQSSPIPPPSAKTFVVKTMHRIALVVSLAVVVVGALWNNCRTVFLLIGQFGVVNGVKQGGVLSPLLFAVYIDGLLIRLEETGVGCHMGIRFIGALAFANDLNC